MILNYLMKNRQLTGYEFIKFCREHGVSASPGNIYPHLSELEEEKLVEYRVEGKKKVYTLTKSGIEELERLPVSRVPEFLRSVFFRNMGLASSIDWSSPDDVTKLLKNLKEAEQFLLDYIRTLREEK